MNVLPKRNAILVSVIIILFTLTLLSIVPYLTLRSYIKRNVDKNIEYVFYVEVEDSLKNSKYPNLATWYLSKVQNFYKAVLNREFLVELPDYNTVFQAYDYTEYPAVFLVKNYDLPTDEISIEFVMPTDFAEFTAVAKLNCGKATTRAGVYSASQQTEKWAILKELRQSNLSEEDRFTLIGKLYRAIPFEEQLSVENGVGQTIQEMLERSEITQDKRQLKLVTTCREDQCDNTSEQCILYIQ